MSDKLTPKQGIFIAEYLVDLNATRAAIAAGVPEKSAAVTAARWRKHPKIAAAIALKQARRVERLDESADRVLLELMRLAYFDPGRLYDADGNRIPVHLLDEDTRRAVALIEDETVGKGPKAVRTQKVKMADKGQNLERLGRYHKLFTDKMEHGLRITLEQLVTGDGEAA